MARNDRPELGDRAQDQISRFVGVVVGTTDYIYGCRRIGLQREKTDKEGKITETQWFDEPQVRVLTRTVVKPVVLVAANPNRTRAPRARAYSGGPARSGDRGR